MHLTPKHIYKQEMHSVQNAKTLKCTGMKNVFDFHYKNIQWVFSYLIDLYFRTKIDISGHPSFFYNFNLFLCH